MAHLDFLANRGCHVIFAAEIKRQTKPLKARANSHFTRAFTRATCAHRAYSLRSRFIEFQLMHVVHNQFTCDSNS